MRHLFALLLAMTLILVCAVSAAAFTDTEDLSEEQLLALEHLSALGVIEGYPDGSFRPEGQVSRAEFAKMLCVFAGQDQLHKEEQAFSDVPTQAWYGGWVARAAEKEWLNGYPGREYRPQARITQEEIATVLVRVAGLDKEGFVWPGDYISAGQEAGFFANITFAGTEPASRIVTCQMLYNALPDKDEQEPDNPPKTPAATETLAGIITSINGSQITVMNARGQSSVYEAAALLPTNLFPGAFIEAQVADTYLIQIGQVFNPQKEAAWWDIALDGSTATIEGKKYNIEEAEIFVVNYTLGKAFSEETFIDAAMINRDVLALGGRLAAEAALVLEEDKGILLRAYLVNASVVISGGRLDVVEGPYSSAKGNGVSFLGRSGGLILDSGLSTPPEGAFIHYSLKNGQISQWHQLYGANDSYLPDVSRILGSGDEEDPYAWVHMNGKASGAAIDLQTTYLPKVIRVIGGRSAVELGISENDCVNYWLAEGCLIYEVKGGNISLGSKSSIEQGRPVIALVNRMGDICYMLCLMD